MSRLRSLVTALLAAVPCVAQATHIVGPGGYASIAAAIGASSPGDIVVVHPGSYQPFIASIGVTIRALIPGTVTIAIGLGPVMNVPPARLRTSSACALGSSASRATRRSPTVSSTARAVASPA